VGYAGRYRNGGSKPNCLTLRRHLNGSRAWLGLLQFFFNHRRFTRSRCGKRLGKSPREAMAGEDHPHWLTLLGLGPFQPRQSWPPEVAELKLIRSLY
jgi:hypothetical protein